MPRGIDTVRNCAEHFSEFGRPLWPSVDQFQEFEANLNSMRLRSVEIELPASMSTLERNASDRLRAALGSA